MLCELHFYEKHLWRGEKCTPQWVMNPVPNIYPQKPSLGRTSLSKPSLLPTQETTRSLPRKRSFPDKLSIFQANE